MGQSWSLCCIFFCPQSIFNKKNLIYEGKNSSVYKLPSKKFICKNVTNYRMFLREQEFIRFMKKKKHDNIIQYYSYIPKLQMFFFIETATSDLLQWVKENSTKPTYKMELIQFFKQMANGYRFLVKNHIEHYDLKPDNLLLVGNILKIGDFGTSQFDMDHYVMYTGTYGFVAPEIVGITNKNYYVPHSMDVYSICVMLAYIELKHVCNRFYCKRPWTLKNYIQLETYTRKMYPSYFIKNGLIVDQRHRMSIDTLLSYLEQV